MNLYVLVRARECDPIGEKMAEVNNHIFWTIRSPGCLPAVIEKVTAVAKSYAWVHRGGL